MTAPAAPAVPTPGTAADDDMWAGEEAATESPKKRGKKPATPGDGLSADERMAHVLVDLAHDHWRLLTVGGKVYGVAHSGPPVIVPLRTAGPNGGNSLRQQLVRIHFEKYRRIPTNNALALALELLESLYIGEETTPAYLRVAPEPGRPDATWLDLGRPDGQCVHVRAGSWRLGIPGPEGPVFRRPRDMMALPIPVRPEGGDWRPGLDRLRSLVNATDATWPLLVGWLLAALRPDMPRPVCYLTGDQGTGKSSAARMLGELLDNADFGDAPRDERALASHAQSRWIVGYDNLSGLSAWFSDQLCRLVTGGAILSRELYTDAELVAVRYKRPVLITTIDAGAASRGDLAERLALVELQPIPARSRREEDMIGRAFREKQPEILGALLELLSAVVAELPAARASMTELPRMADWAVLLRALDRVTGWEAVPHYSASLTDLAATAGEGDTLVTSLVAWATRDGAPSVWHGYMGQLLELLAPPEPRPKSWPSTPSAFSGRLRRARTSLRALGVDMEVHKRDRKGVPITIRVLSDHQ